MINFAASSNEVFQILQSFDYTVMLYGEDGNRVEEPTEARRMFARPENLMVSMVDDGDNSCVRLYIGSNTKIPAILGLISSLRTAASKYSLLFNVQQYGRQIKPKDFAGNSKGDANIDEAIVSQYASVLAERIMKNVIKAK